MGIELVSRVIIVNDALSLVETSSGSLVELVFGRRTDTGDIGYSIDDGATWTWIGASGAGSSCCEVIMESGVLPPTPVLNSAGDDWVYSS